ncbi:MAG TPA: GDSL-type esterase/lipase family protein [Candidatus Binatia bacterium]
MRILTAILVALSLAAPAAAADEIKIVSLGASQTNGKGVAQSDSYPAQLEKILKAEGYAVSVANEGVDGDTTRDILNRLNRAVPDRTKIVIVQPGTNDKTSTKRHNSLDPAETKNNVEQILGSLRKKNITAMLLGYPGEGGREIAEKHSAIWYGQPTKDISRDLIQADGQHLTKEGYAVLAKKISLQIKDLIDKPQK